MRRSASPPPMGGALRWWRRVGLPGLALLLVAGVSRAAEGMGEREARDAVRELARTTYRWQATERQRVRSETAEPPLARTPPVAVEGVKAADGLWQVSVRSPRLVPVPVTVVFRDGDAVAQTPSGWWRRAELRQPSGGDREVAVDGRKVRLTRVFAGALKAMEQRLPTEEILDLMPDIKTWRGLEGLVVGQLSEAAIEKLWGDPEARRAPEVQGTVIFKFGDAGLAECHVALAIGFSNARTKATTWTVQQWSLRFTDVGAAQLDLPDEAVAALDRAP